MSSKNLWQTRLPPTLPHKGQFAVVGHCRYATALHGRQFSLLPMEGAYRGVERGQRTRSSLNSRSVFRPPSFLRNLETYRRRVVRELLSHYNNDPLQCADERASTSMIIGTGLMICPTAGAKRRHARRGTMPPFHFRAFLRGCLLGTSILLGLCVLGAVAVGLLWRFMFAPWW
jgi:hypothetical protein